MGIKYEINWYLVANSINEIKKEENNIFALKKNERRIYPVDSVIPLIIKNLGCIGLVKIKSTLIDTTTTIKFESIMDFKVNDPIAKHYNDLYLMMKTE